MKKIIVPMLLIVFALFFSGKPFKQKDISVNCGPIFHITNFYSLPVTQMVIEDLTAGTTTTINNPTFIYQQNFQGPQFRLTFHFNGNFTGQIMLSGDNGDCNIPPPYRNQNTWQMTFSATCSWYLIELVAETGWSCP